MKIGYSRVSTNDQNQQLQIDALTKENCERIYQENLSGNSKNRPVLAQMLEALREGDIVVVWRLDRLGRSIKDLIELVEGFKNQNIEFMSITENIDTSSPSGELIFHMFASLAQFERSLIIERTNAGLAAARARGRVGGRKPKMTDGDIAKAQALAKSNDVSITDIANHFGVSRTTLYKYL